MSPRAMQLGGGEGGGEGGGGLGGGDESPNASTGKGSLPLKKRRMGELEALGHPERELRKPRGNVSYT